MHYCPGFIANQIKINLWKEEVGFPGSSKCAHRLADHYTLEQELANSGSRAQPNCQLLS